MDSTILTPQVDREAGTATGSETKFNLHLPHRYEIMKGSGNAVLAPRRSSI